MPGPRTTRHSGVAILPRLNSRNGWPNSGSRVLCAQTEPLMRRARSPLMDVASIGSSGTVGSTGSFSGNAADIYYRASRSVNISGRGSWRPLRNPQRYLQAQVRFLRYDGPGTDVPGSLFSAAIHAGDDTGSQGRSPS